MEEEKSKKIEPEDFLAMFLKLNLPVNFADSSLSKKPTDSPLAWIRYSVSLFLIP